NNEWIVDDLAFETVLFEGSTSDFDYPVATFTFQIQRQSSIYVVTIIIPSFVLTILCVLGMFWPKSDQTDYLGQVGCGLSVVLAMCAILQIAKQDIPKTNELPSLSVYIMVNLLIVAVAISCMIVSSKLGHSSKFGMCRAFKRHFHRLFHRLNVEFRVICLLMFTAATIINLLILILKV
ncbi:unnamed protein product, partial [Cylicocyclus nassatus]